jgi:hypothetical protein
MSEASVSSVRRPSFARRLHLLDYHSDLPMQDYSEAADADRMQCVCTIFDGLFSRSLADNIELSTAGTAELKLTRRGWTYGETNLESLLLMLRAADLPSYCCTCSLPPADHHARCERCGKRAAGAVILDLGSGCGNVVVAVALMVASTLLPTAAVVRGIELLPTLHRAAAKSVSELQARFRSAEAAGTSLLPARLPHTEVCCDDLAVHDFSDADVCYLCSTAFTSGYITRWCAHAARTLRPGSRVVCLSVPLPHSAFALEASLACETSWGCERAFVHRVQRSSTTQTAADADFSRRLRNLDSVTAAALLIRSGPPGPHDNERRPEQKHDDYVDRHPCASFVEVTPEVAEVAVRAIETCGGGSFARTEILSLPDHACGSDDDGARPANTSCVHRFVLRPPRAASLNEQLRRDALSRREGGGGVIHSNAGGYQSPYEAFDAVSHSEDAWYGGLRSLVLEALRAVLAGGCPYNLSASNRQLDTREARPHTSSHTLFSLSLSLTHTHTHTHTHGERTAAKLSRARDAESTSHLYSHACGSCAWDGSMRRAPSCWMCQCRLAFGLPTSARPRRHRVQRRVLR